MIARAGARWRAMLLSRSPGKASPASGFLRDRVEGVSSLGGPSQSTAKMTTE